VEDEIDLREYIDVLIHHWKAIVALTVIAALFAGVVSFLLPPTYEAVATLVATGERYRLTFDSRFQSVDTVLPPQAYSGLLKISQLETKVLEELGSGFFDEPLTLEELDGSAEVEAGKDPTVFYLKVRFRDPEKAAAIANTWAALYVQEVNDLYGYSDKEIATLESQLAAAEEALNTSAEALRAFREESGLGLLETGTEGMDISISQGESSMAYTYWGPAGRELGAKLQLMASYQVAADRLRVTLEEAEGLQQEVAAGQVSATTATTSLLAELVRIGLADVAQDANINLDLSGLEGEDSLEAVVSALRVKQTVLAQALEQLDTEIAALQVELAAKRQQWDQLSRKYSVAEDTYTTLSRKVQEVRIAEQTNEDEVRIASLAAVPTEPVAPKKMINVAVAGTLGLFVGVFGVFAWEYLTSPRAEMKSSRDNRPD
jgi:succinoglycan biosynthesis transport protein ExoP